MLGSNNIVNVVNGSFIGNCSIKRCKCKPKFMLFVDDGMPKMSRLLSESCPKHLPLLTKRANEDNKKRLLENKKKPLIDPFKLDLRQNITTGESYYIHYIGGFMGFCVTYRWQGFYFERLMAHENTKFFADFKEKLTKKEFNDALAKMDRRHVTQMGVMNVKKDN